MRRSTGESALMGIHHITAIASDPQRNVDFFVGVLGLRLVKRTVNFDSPDVHHLYYGDESGTPGTILTFFPFQDAGRGKRGAGEVGSVAFHLPPAARDYWIHRLSQHGISFQGPVRRFGEELISFEDPDGLSIDFVFSHSERANHAWADGPVPPEHSVRGFAGATLLLRDSSQTETMLQTVLGFQPAGSEGERKRFLLGDGDLVAAVDLVIDPKSPPARPGAGSIHHIAWRVSGYDHQADWRTRIAEAGHSVTDIVDRQYFKSVYFHEPGGVLFEIATDEPGFTVDEPKEALGTTLKLPPWLELHRRQLERVLPPIDNSLSRHSQQQTVVN
ncbi:MAG TPA: ring-cleaving dioxygenase [Bacteroidetes bacterium]|nr:ring-cleaving dioxygenase [Bacteroidota bacterium]